MVHQIKYYLHKYADLTSVTKHPDVAQVWVPEIPALGRKRQDLL